MDLQSVRVSRPDFLDRLKYDEVMAMLAEYRPGAFMLMAFPHVPAPRGGSIWDELADAEQQQAAADWEAAFDEAEGGGGEV